MIKPARDLEALMAEWEESRTNVAKLVEKLATGLPMTPRERQRLVDAIADKDAKRPSHRPKEKPNIGFAAKVLQLVNSQRAFGLSEKAAVGFVADALGLNERKIRRLMTYARAFNAELEENHRRILTEIEKRSCQ